jgi:hypothetical protein
MSEFFFFLVFCPWFLFNVIFFAHKLVERYSGLNEFLKFCGVEKREVMLSDGTTTDSDDEDGSGEKAAKTTTKTSGDSNGGGKKKKRETKQFQHFSRWQDITCMLDFVVVVHLHVVVVVVFLDVQGNSLLVCEI